MASKVPEGVLHQRWLHSHEDDTAMESVFRPASYKFPPARGRTGFELKADGSLVELGIGATDRRQEAQGTWKLQDGDKLAFYTTSERTPSRVMQIIDAAVDRLVVKR